MSFGFVEVPLKLWWKFSVFPKSQRLFYRGLKNLSKRKALRSNVRARTLKLALPLTTINQNPVPIIIRITKNLTIVAITWKRPANFFNENKLMYARGIRAQNPTRRGRFPEVARFLLKATLMPLVKYSPKAMVWIARIAGYVRVVATKRKAAAMGCHFTWVRYEKSQPEKNYPMLFIKALKSTNLIFWWMSPIQCKKDLQILLSQLRVPT